MDGVRQWALGICLTVLVNAVVQYLIPSGSMEKMLRLVLGAFVLCGILVPLVQVLPNIEWEVEDIPAAYEQAGDFTESVDQQVLSQAEQNIRILVAQELQKRGVACENIAVFMDRNEDGSIRMDKVVVTLGKDGQNQAPGLAPDLENTLGIQTEVVIDGETG